MLRPNKLSGLKSTDSLSRRKDKRFYQTNQWRKFRHDYKRQKRKEHEKIVLEAYKSNPKNKPEDLFAFLNSDNPLCSINLKKGIIKVASVLDHKKPIRKGGARFKKSNLQWITEHQHAVKSGREAHE